MIQKCLSQKLLARINEQLEGKNILVKQGAIVDAALVTSARRTRKVIDIRASDTGRRGRPACGLKC